MDVPAQYDQIKAFERQCEIEQGVHGKPDKLTPYDYAVRLRFLGDRVRRPREVLQFEQICQRCDQFTGDGCRRLEQGCCNGGRWKQVLLSGWCERWGEVMSGLCSPGDT